MNEVAEIEVPTQENVHADLRSLFRGAVKLTLETVLDEIVREMIGGPNFSSSFSGGGQGRSRWSITRSASRFVQPICGSNSARSANPALLGAAPCGGWGVTPGSRERGGGDRAEPK
jgi:hypothetical protein